MSRHYEPSASDRHALIAWLAQEFGGRRELGKTAVQKLVHILDEGLDVSTGYAFTLYTYGPFSRNLAGDMDIVRYLRGIAIEYVSDENRYVVSAGETNQIVISHAQEFLAHFRASLDNLKEAFFDKKPRYLELFSTLLFIRKRKPDISDDELGRQLHSLKPKYDEKERSHAIDDLKRFLEQKASN